MDFKNKCFSPECINQAETEYCPACLAKGGIKPYVNEQFENNFKYHSPKEGQPERYQLIRDKSKELAYLINGNCPNSREKSLAITNIEQAMMWANASIARNE
ncbi:DUF7681 family protein [Lysinibacillus xylanilyticus]|uniref:Acb2/Tad1 domain-containing protein n=1 Tax=Lysinibacillus xylanilyticus TaxID=582475 RepID=UPI003CFEE276